MLGHLGYAYSIAGRRSEAKRVLAELETHAARSYVSPYGFIFIYLGLGETDQAFEWFEKAYQAQDPKLVTLKIHPRWDKLRADPRFADLERRVWSTPAGAILRPLPHKRFMCAR